MALPQYIVDQYGSTREYKQTKRRQIRALEKALKDLRGGCAYLPNEGYRLFDQISFNVKDLRDITSLKNWGR